MSSTLVNTATSAAYSSASRADDMRIAPAWARVSIAIAQHVARAAHRVQQGPVETPVDRRAQTADVDVDDIGLGIEVQIPDRFEQHGPRDHLPGTPRQELEELEFLAGEVDG